MTRDDTMPDALTRRELIAGAACAIGGVALAGLPTVALSQQPSAHEIPTVPVDATKLQGAPTSAVGNRSTFVKPVRTPIGEVTGSSFAPLEQLTGTITPADLHFERHHAGVPLIAPSRHQLLVHGLVERPLIFTVDEIRRFPQITRTCFIECSGNGRSAFREPKPEMTPQKAAGLTSNTEWTGVLLKVLFSEAGVRDSASWFLAEGGDACVMTRSIPVAKAMDDAMIVFYQNGEPIMPWNGYPMRLLLPGYEGNMNVKWLRRLKLTDAPVMAINESRQYTLLLDSGKAWRFYYPQEVKSFITRPSPDMQIPSPGFYEISGVAYSGHGRVSKVEVSADGGKSWGLAAMQGQVLPKALTRFRMPWNWNGQPVVLQSRATDEGGNVQPTRYQLIAERGEPRGTPPVVAFPMEHVNCISSWAVDAKGAVSHVYA